RRDAWRGRTRAAPRPGRAEEAPQGQGKLISGGRPMEKWTVRVGGGWQDQMPAEVQNELRSAQGTGALATLVVIGGSHLPGFQESGSTMIYDGAVGATHAMLLFRTLRNFLRGLQNPAIDGLSLLF